MLLDRNFELLNSLSFDSWIFELFFNMGLYTICSWLFDSWYSIFFGLLILMVFVDFYFDFGG